jgi:hypothetical protein
MMDIVIPIPEWVEETQRDEAEITNREDIITALVKEKVNTGKVARWVIVNRELGLADDDILPGNKMLFYTGAREAVIEVAQNERHEVKTEAGNKLEGRSLVYVQDNGGGRYVRSNSKAGLKGAIHYLTHTLTGHIMPRLVTIAENKGDVRAYADELKAAIDEMVTAIVEPGSA